jgi:hypothetical protein
VTTGPLRGLASRALGLERPLRSLRAPSFENLASDETPLAQAVAPVTLLHLAGTAESRQRAATSSPLGTVIEVSAQTPADALEGAAPASLAEPPAPRPARVVSASLARAAPSPYARIAAENEPRASTGSTVSERSLPPTTATESTPAPLMPLRTTPILPRASLRAEHRATSSAPARPAAALIPTEVHVSIGRVELIAAPPRPAAAASRSAPRRDDADGRSLAAYLRGDGRSVR